MLTAIEMFLIFSKITFKLKDENAQKKSCKISPWAFNLEVICMGNNNKKEFSPKEQNNRLQQVSHWCYYYV